MDLVKYFLSQDSIELGGLMRRASRNLNKDMVLLLLDNGVDINERYETSLTALDVVGQGVFGNFDARVSEDKDAFIAWMKSLAAKTEREIIEELIDKRDFEGLTAFMKIRSDKIDRYIWNAIGSEDKEMALFLFSSKRYYSDSDQMRSAIRFRTQYLINYCLEQGVDINISIGDGKFPLDVYRRGMKYLKGEKLEQLKAVEQWMVSKGAKSKN